jgi:hypothetical protein
VTNWKAAAILTFIVAILLGLGLAIFVGLSENVVYPIDDLGTTSVESILWEYINPWFFLVELPFVLISPVVGLAIGSRTMSKERKVVGSWTILVLTLLGGCLYTILSFLTYDWLYQLVPQTPAWLNLGIDAHTFIQLAIANATVLSKYFLTAFVFIVLGVVAGLLVWREYERNPKNAARILAERTCTTDTKLTLSSEAVHLLGICCYPSS